MSNPQPYHGLTKQDLAALKTGDGIAFVYTHNLDNAEAEPESYMEVIKDKSDSNPWSQQHRFPVNYYTHCLGWYHYVSPPQVYRATHTESTWLLTVKTWVNALRADDVIRLDWVGDSLVGDRTYVVDRLSLTVLRKGAEAICFPIVTDVTERDGGGRMIQVSYPARAEQEANA